MSDGRTLGTLVGGVLGFFTGGVGYVAFGAALGGFAGGLLDPQSNNAEPQRLEDLKVSVSTYGAGIPETWGNDIPPGTWIWTTDIQEVPQYYGSSGKGGGEEGPSSYFYLVHGLICLGKSRPGMTPSIRKVYKDGELKFDASTDLSVAQALATEENPFVGIQLLDGNEDQLPPAFIEIWEGAGNVPGYRGLLTVLVVGLETPGGRIPQLSFEICWDADVVVERKTFGLFGAETDSQYAVIRKDQAWVFWETGAPWAGTWKLNVVLIGNGYVRPQKGVAIEENHFTDTTLPLSGDGDPRAIRLRAPTDGPLGQTHQLEVVFLSEGTIGPIANFTPQLDTDRIRPANGGYDDSTGTYAILNRTLNDVVIVTPERQILHTTVISGTPGAVTIKANRAYALADEGDVVKVHVFNALTGEWIATRTGPSIGLLNVESSALHPADDALYVWFVGGTAESYLYVMDYQTGVFTQLGTQIDTIPRRKSSAITSTMYADRNVALVGPSTMDVDGNAFFTMCRLHVVSPQAANVAAIFLDQSTRAGLQLDQVDVSGIDDLIFGCTLNKSPSSARSNISPLLTYSGAAMVEEDGIVKFFHRGSKTPGEVIPWDELGCTEDGQEAGDPAPLTRQQEAECPRSLTVSYSNPSFDYQISTEQAARLTTESEFDEQVDIPLVMTSDRAATLAHRLLYERWVGRNARSTKLSRKYAMLSPGDVRPLEYRQGTTGNFMAVKVTDTGALIEVDWIPSDAELLTQTVTGSQGYQAQEIAPLPAPLQLQVLDIPILRDDDNNAGVYVAIDSLADVPAKGQLFVGNDETTLQSRGSVSDSAPIGMAETALPAGPIGVVDEATLVTVFMGTEDLASVTRDALLSGGGEYWAIGAPGRWEIGASAQADSLGGGRFILSRHFRGLFGTEANMSTHQVGDTVVLLRSVGMLRPSMSVGEIGQEKSYRVVAAGRRFDSAESSQYAQTGEGLRPLSPVNIRRTDTNGLTVDRRSRLSMNYSTGSVPLGEATEAFRWTFYSSGAFSTVLGVAETASASITAAQITAAGATPSATLYVRVSQLSDSVGPGHELQATV